MKIAVLIARILLGLLFLVAGAMKFYFAATTGGPPPPPMPGLAGQFTDIMFKSHYIMVVCAFEVIAGVLLLVNRYVRLALVIVAALLVNILTYHATMYPAGIVPGLIAVVLWFVVAWPQRARFAAFFSAV